MHGKIASQLKDCVDEGQVPEWIVLGRTVLVIKEPDKGNLAGNYRPIICFSRKEGRRGLISLDDYVTLEELSLVDYLSQNCEERLLKAVWRGRNRSELEHPDDYKLEKKAPWAIHMTDKKGGC